MPSNEPTPAVGDELDWLAAYIADIAKPNTSSDQLDIMYNIKQLVTAQTNQAFKHGQRVGQYQAADKLYGDVTNIYLFNNHEAQNLKDNAASHAEEMLKDCEKYMNHNAKDYRQYIKSLTEQEQTE